MEVKVTPFVGVWIETLDLLACLVKKYVTPFVGVWIETIGNSFNSILLKSHPSWVCGLKQSCTLANDGTEGHTLRGCVD